MPVAHVEILSAVSHPLRDAILGAIVARLSPLEGSWRVDIQPVERTRWWELTVEGEAASFRLLLGKEEQTSERVGERLKTALAQRHLGG